MNSSSGDDDIGVIRAITLKIGPAHVVPTPQHGKQTIFIDSADNQLKTKDHTGTVHAVFPYNKACPECHLLYKDIHPASDCIYAVTEKIMES